MPLYQSDWDDWYQTVDAEERDFTTRGLPSSRGNIANEGAVFDPLPLRAVLENARSLQRAITGEETSGVLTDPAEGHAHDEGWDAVMPWCQIASYALATNKYGGASASVPHRLGYIADSTSYVAIVRAPLIVPIGQTRIVPVFYVKISNANTLTVKFEIYETDNYNTTAIASCETSIGTGSIDGGVVSDETGLDVSGVATDANGYRVVYVAVDVKVSSSTAAIREVVVRFPYRGYRQREERTEIDTTYLEADLVPNVDTLSTLYVNNPLYLRRSIYGTTHRLPARSLPHNHGEQRGEILKRGILHTSFGPYNFEDLVATSGGTVGIPVPYSTTVDFATDPKLLTSQIVFVPGQAQQIKGFLVGYVAGSSAPRTYTLAVELRPIGGAFKDPTANDDNGNEVTTAVISRASDGYDGTSFTLDTAGFGNVAQDRLLELNLWLITTPASTESYRLTGLAVYVATTGPNSLFADDETQPAKEQIALMRVRENQEINSLLTAQFRAVSNQICRESLGGVPGLRNDLSTPNTARAWKAKVQEVHQHRGTFTDVMGALVYDGAVIRQPLLSQCYLGRVTDDNAESDYEAEDSTASWGIKIHSGASMNSVEWVVLEHTVSIPQGLGAIDLYGVINPNTTDPRGRLFCFVELLAEGSSGNLATSIRCGQYEGTDNITGKSSTEIYCEVLPKESPVFAKNASRIRRGLGCWTLDALREESTVAEYQFDRPYRVTQPIRIVIAPTYSGAYRLRVRWALQEGDYTLPINGTCAINARILGMFAVPSKGF